jgi:membrane protein DedA with SNARE-associated domain/anti-anti-sigma regulatory factor
VLAELSLAGLIAVVAGLMLVDGTPLVGLLIPGDLVVVSASTVAGWPAVLVAVVAGTAALVSGHAAGYLTGRHYGAHLWASGIGRRIGFERWCRVERTLRNGGDRTLVATPFIPVVNTVLPLLAGALGVRPGRYLLLIVLADAAWIGVWAGVGLGSQQLATLLGAADVALLVSVSVSLAVLMATTLVLRHSHRRAHPRGPVPQARSAQPSPDDGAELPACMAGHVRDAAPAITAAYLDKADDRFTVTTREPVPGVRVVIAADEATIVNSPVLDAALRAQVAAAPEHLVVDLTGVLFLNYHAVVSLVSVHRAAARAGIEFHLVGVDTPAVHRPLRIAGVLRHLDRHRRPSLTDVLADVEADRARTGRASKPEHVLARRTSNQRRRSGMDWPEETLAAVDAADMAEVVGGDGEHRPLGIWAVRVDDAIYVRNWQGQTDGWQAGFRGSGRGTLTVAGVSQAVTAVPVDDPATQTTIDAAYTAKYDNGANAAYVADMVAPAARHTTLRLDPTDHRGLHR